MPNVRIPVLYVPHTNLERQAAADIKKLGALPLYRENNYLNEYLEAKDNPFDVNMKFAQDYSLRLAEISDGLFLNPGWSNDTETLSLVRQYREWGREASIYYFDSGVLLFDDHPDYVRLKFAVETFRKG